MWKAFSRSVCEVVERRVGVTAFRSDIPNRKTADASKQSKKPCRGQLSCYIPQLKTYCPLKQLKTFRFRETSHEQSGERQQHENKNHARTDPPFTACLGAMGWSTVLVLGWYLSHPLGRRIFGDSNYKELCLHSPRYFSCGRTVHAQSPIQPIAIRPISYSSSIEEEGSNANSFRSSLTSSSGDVNDLLTHQRGPFTPEEALNEVSRVFQEASRALSGDVENRLGMVCMSRGQHSEAMKHFRRASHHENAVAAYNMGQCYELGLGTSRNLKKAAKWYKIGTDRGHPTSMYNLAVFLANGWGGLCEDQCRARELLVMASSLGLKEAESALKSIDEEFYVHVDSHIGSKEESCMKSSTDEFLELIGEMSGKNLDKPVNTKFQGTQTYLSHLDWLDLSSTASFSSDEILHTSEETSLPRSICLENDCSLSSNDSGQEEKSKDHQSGNSMLFFIDCAGSSSTGAESLDEATNCRIFTRPL